MQQTCISAVRHVCYQTCSDCMASRPCGFSHIRYPCADCNRHFRILKCFANNQQRTLNKKSVCERKRCCTTCGWLVTQGNHECNKQFCENCNQNRDVDHLCYMRPLKSALPSAGDNVVYVFYDFETTQNTRHTDKAWLHVPNFVCVRCGRRKHSFWEDPVGDLLSYLTEPRPWANKIVAITHNAKAFDVHFILNRAFLLKWKTEMIMNGLNLMCMKMEHLALLDSVSFLPCVSYTRRSV